jgi:acyl CoA:acetate/3-ketoacid CoA transferase beta subunit
VDLILTNLAVIEVTSEVLVLKETAPDVLADDLRKVTAATLKTDDVKVMDL